MNTLLKLYLQKTLTLVRGIRLKSEGTAIASNNYLSAMGYVVDPNPETWKYYLNLNGQYHESDTMMTIVSNDTQEVIEFTKENLQIHLLTAKTYTVGSRYYQDLKTRYPTQESLIKGIIQPTDIQYALSLGDHKILNYPTELVESNESYLIPELQRYIDNFFFLRHNPDYMLFEPSYYVVLLGELRMAMFMEVLRLRTQACLTERAHSFHVQQYLLSHSPVGKEFDYMTFPQRMWFYKNIRYINRNIGQHETFEKLTKRVLTDRGFSLVGYDFTKTTVGMPDTITPTPSFIQVPINGIAPASGNDDKTVEQMIEFEYSQAPDNPVILDSSIPLVTEIGETSNYGRVPTKVLESNTIDRTDSDPFTMTEVTLNHWIYLGYFNRYQTVIALTNPTNGDVYNLSMRDAFLLFLYCYNKAIGVNLVHLPKVRANRVIRQPLPTFAELRGMVDVDVIPDYYLTKILKDQPNLSTYISTSAFRGLCKEIWTVLLKHRELRFFSGDFVKEGALHTLVDRCYMDIALNFGDDVLYDTWLNDRGIQFENLRDFGYMELAQSILGICTGADLADVTKLKDIHQAMLRIMQRMSSYSVQFIGVINDSAIKVIDGKFPMMGANEYTETLNMTYDAYLPTVVEQTFRDRTTFHYPIAANVDNVTFDDGGVVMNIPVNAFIQSDTLDVFTHYVPSTFPAIGIVPMDPVELEGTFEVDNPYVLPVGAPGTLTKTLTGYEMTSVQLNAFLQRGNS